MARVENKYKTSLPVTIACAAALAILFYLIMSYFLEDYRKDTYSQIINSNITALKETTDTLISKTTEGFGHCQHEVRVLGVGLSQKLLAEGFSSVSELTSDDIAYLEAFGRTSVFDYCMLLNEYGRGIYTDGEGIHEINMYSSRAYVECLSSPTGETISFISDPLSSEGRDVIAFSARSGAVTMIGIYGQESFEALYDSATFGDHASYMITTDSGLILSSAHVKQEIKDALNLFSYFREEPRNESFFELDEEGQSGYTRMALDFQQRNGGSTELYFQGALYELAYAPIPQTRWNFISCVSYDYITADAAEINQQTLKLTFFIIVLLLGMFVAIAVMMIYIVRASASRKAARRERIFTLMTHYVPNVIIIADSESGELEYSSRNTDKVLGITGDIANLLDEEVMACIDSQDRPKVLTLIDRVRSGRSVSESSVINFTRPDSGAHIVLSLNGYLIAEQDSRQRFVTLTFEDITDRVTSRRRLEEALTNEEQANAAKSTFLANMSHDIRTPLNAVIGLTTLALYHQEDKKRVAECLQKIANSSQLLLGLINDVLDMSKIESGNMQLSRSEFELGEWIDGIVTVTHSQTSVRGQHFSVRACNISHELLCGDTVRLSQILTNVLGNAVKFTPEGGSIRLEMTEISSENPLYARFVFRVTDTGIGMPPEYLDHIFDIFSREPGTNERNIQGTGLGMAITKSIVDMMGGTIAVRSEQNKGTEFTIELPILVSQRTNARLEEYHALVLGEPGCRADCEDAAAKMQAIGLKAICCLDYREAAAYAEKEAEHGCPLDLIYLPYQVILDKKELTIEKLKEEFGENIRVLAGFGLEESSLWDQARQAGFYDMIGVPLFQEELRRKISAIMASAEEDPDSAMNLLSGTRILLVEDNELNTEIMVDMLTSMMGATVDTASNGQEGCEKFAYAPENTYDFILMDLQMPVLNGLEATHRIRASAHPQAREIPIIALTANAFEEDRQAVAECGMNGFVSKPVDVSRLYKEMVRVLKQNHPLHLLLAEDNQINREIAVELLTAEGCRVDSAENGKEALDSYLAAPANSYDAVLLDLRMPVMDGYEAAKRIRESKKADANRVPIIALTASQEDEVAEGTAAAGMSAVLSKPIDMAALKRVIKKIHA